MRRGVFRGVLSLALPLLAVLALTASSYGAAWCKRDPIVKLGADTVQILVAVPELDVPRVKGAIATEIKSPNGMTQELLFLDAGFNGYGETVQFNQTSRTDRHEIFVKVPIRGGAPVPMQIEVFRNDVLEVVKVAPSADAGAWVYLPR